MDVSNYETVLGKSNLVLGLVHWEKRTIKGPCFAVYICRSAPTGLCYVQFDNGSYMLLTNHPFCECVLQLVGGLSSPD